MSTGALLFMLVSWTLVLGLTFWSYSRVLRKRRHFDPDGIGPEAPPEPGAAEGVLPPHEY
jgi:hypothetical protein